MPALSGQVTSAVTKNDGTPAVTVTWFYNVSTYALRNNPIAWTAPSGTVYPIGSGAIIADNLLGRAVRMRINDASGVLIRRVQIPIGGRAVTANTLANQAPPDGPYTTLQDLNGITFDLS
jgi:hypothetical protein